MKRSAKMPFFSKRLSSSSVLGKVRGAAGWRAMAQASKGLYLVPP